jgi:hypothetical protein
MGVRVVRSTRKRSSNSGPSGRNAMPWRPGTMTYKEARAINRAKGITASRGPGSWMDNSRAYNVRRAGGTPNLDVTPRKGRDKDAIFHPNVRLDSSQVEKSAPPGAKGRPGEYRRHVVKPVAAQKRHPDIFKPKKPTPSQGDIPRPATVRASKPKKTYTKPKLGRRAS